MKEKPLLTKNDRKNDVTNFQLIIKITIISS